MAQRRKDAVDEMIKTLERRKFPVGKLRLLATYGSKRTKRWPNVPTLKDLGHGIVATSPYGLVGPRGLPVAVVQALHDAFRAALPGHPEDAARIQAHPALQDTTSRLNVLTHR